ncbi:glycosyltransferase [Acetobacter cibinongensis]|uniref:glycosyltransferase n=1 Tax=Acetobacter cibinongensis TaxID=146475 RepID=UPI000A3B06F7|nr:glycosyltransferase [Acetobacter cibinongensis]
MNTAPDPITATNISQTGNSGLLPLFLHVTLVDEDTRGCAFMPVTNWILSTFVPDHLVLINASQTAIQTLTSVVKAQSAAILIHEYDSIAGTKSHDNCVYYCGNPTNTSVDAKTKWLQMLPEGSIVLFEDSDLSPIDPTKLPLSFTSTHLDYGAGLLLLSTPKTSACLSPLVQTSKNTSDTEHFLFLEKCKFFADYWATKARIALSEKTKEKNGLVNVQARFLMIETLEKEKIISEKNIKISSLLNENRDLVSTLEQAKAREKEWLSFSQTVLQTQDALTSLKNFFAQPRNILKDVARVILNKNLEVFVPSLPTPPSFPSQSIPSSDHNTSDIVCLEKEKIEIYSPETELGRVVFVIGDTEAEQLTQRCAHNAEAARLAGYTVRLKSCPEIGPDDIDWATILVFYRVEFSDHVSIMMQIAQERSMPIIFDIDALLCMPRLARSESVSAQFSSLFSEEQLETYFYTLWRTLVRASICTATTDTLAQTLRLDRPISYTLPNIYDVATWQSGRNNFRAGRIFEDNSSVTLGLGYDISKNSSFFKSISTTIGSVLQKYSHVKLRLFTHEFSDKNTYIEKYFPELIPSINQIIWQKLDSNNDSMLNWKGVDIALFPCPTDNVYFTSQSENIYLETALCNIPLITSPLPAYRECIEDGASGFLAEGIEQWHAALVKLIENNDIRHSVGLNAYHGCLWYFSVQRQAKLLKSIFESTKSEESACQEFERQIARKSYRAKSLPDIVGCDVIFQKDTLSPSDVSVIITSYNYEHYLLDALESVRLQTLGALDLIVVDDGSTDFSVALTHEWMKRNAHRFKRVLLLRTTHNSGLGAARNCGVAYAETPYFLPLDADNKLLPNACAALLAATSPMTAYAYPMQQQFGDTTADHILGQSPYTPSRLQAGNYIDAMALIAKWAWAACGGYYVNRAAMGWEDYDLWCSMAELGLQGTHVAEVLAEYRVHGNSMTSCVTEQGDHKHSVIALLEQRHPWIKLVQKDLRTTR